MKDQNRIQYAVANIVQMLIMLAAIIRLAIDPSQQHAVYLIGLITVLFAAYGKQQAITAALASHAAQRAADARRPVSNTLVQEYLQFTRQLQDQIKHAHERLITEAVNQVELLKEDKPLDEQQRELNEQIIKQCNDCATEIRERDFYHVPGEPLTQDEIDAHQLIDPEVEDQSANDTQKVEVQSDYPSVLAEEVEPGPGVWGVMSCPNHPTLKTGYLIRLQPHSDTGETLAVDQDAVVHSMREDYQPVELVLWRGSKAPWRGMPTG